MPHEHGFRDTHGVRNKHGLPDHPPPVMRHHHHKRRWLITRARSPDPSPRQRHSRTYNGTRAYHTVCASGRWCTADAAYNAQYDDYDVYVHSNRPRRTATATASNGKSWSYETNGNGYADIYFTPIPAIH